MRMIAGEWSEAKARMRVGEWERVVGGDAACLSHRGVEETVQGFEGENEGMIRKTVLAFRLFASDIRSATLPTA